VTELGGTVPGYPHLSKERESWEQNLQLGIILNFFEEKKEQIFKELMKYL
jgi:hypothetical protein